MGSSNLRYVANNHHRVCIVTVTGICVGSQGKVREFFFAKPVATLQLQDEMRNILVLGFSAYYIRGLTFTHCGNPSITVSHGCYIHHACCSNGCVCWQPDGVLLSYASNNFQCYNQQPYTSTCPTHWMYWILCIIVWLYWSSNRLTVFPVLQAAGKTINMLAASLNMVYDHHHCLCWQSNG